MHLLRTHSQCHTACTVLSLLFCCASTHRMCSLEPRFVDLLVTDWNHVSGKSYNQVLLINRGGSEVRDASGAWPPQESIIVEAVLTGSHVVIRAPPWLATL